MNNRENKKLRVLLSLLVFVMVLSLFSGLALAVGPIEVELGTVSPTYAGDSIVLTLTNNTASVITVEAPYRVKVDDYDIANVDPSWILFTGELAAGETKEIATIPSGEGWQNFWGKSGYGPPQTSYYSIQAWLIVNGVEWESAIFTHTVEPPPPCEEGEVCASGTTFIADNKNGTCTFEVWVKDFQDQPISGLGEGDFVVSEHLTKPPVEVGSIVGVEETTPGVYSVIWSYEDGNHSYDVWVAGKPVALGLSMTISTSDILLGTVSPTYFLDTIVLTLTNNSTSSITVEAPYQVKVDNHDIANVDPLWILFTGELAAGETKEIAAIPSGEGWQSFMGKGGPGPVRESDYYFQAWLMVDGQEWESNVVLHKLMPSSPCEEGEVCASGTTFIADNKNGTCTFEVWVKDNQNNPIIGLGPGDFVVSAHLTKPPVMIGSIVGVVEKTPGVYSVIWSYEDGNHSYDIWAAGKTVALGLPMTISSSSQSQVVTDYTSGDSVEFYEGKVTMYVTTEEGSFAVEAYLYYEDEEKEAPLNLQPANLFLSMERSQNIDGDTIRVVLNYDPNELPEGLDEESLKLYRYNDETNSWDEVANQGINLEENYIWMDIDTFSTYGVFGTETEGPADDDDTEGELPLTGSNNNGFLGFGMFFIFAGIVLLRLRTKEGQQL